MSRELIEFSNLIDEQFEPDTTVADELWAVVQSWFAHDHSSGNPEKQTLPATQSDDTKMVA